MTQLGIFDFTFFTEDLLLALLPRLALAPTPTLGAEATLEFYFFKKNNFWKKFCVWNDANAFRSNDFNVLRPISNPF